MTKPGNSKSRRRTRARLRTAIEPFEFGYVLDEVARVLEVPGDGRISLIVRGGYVVGKEVTRLPSDDRELRRRLGISSTNPVIARLMRLEDSKKTSNKPLQ